MFFDIYVNKVGFDEYFIKNVEISIDDKVKFYNISTEISWVIKLVDSASGGSWVVDENEGIICQETGSYDLYLKMKYQASNFLLWILHY